MIQVIRVGVAIGEPYVTGWSSPGVPEVCLEECMVLPNLNRLSGDHQRLPWGDSKNEASPSVCIVFSDS